VRIQPAILLVPALLACTEAAPTSHFLTRDSAGVRIVESSTPQWGPGEEWTVEAVPFLDLTTSGAGPDHEFFRVRNAIRTSEGRIYVANWGTNEIKAFSDTGDFLGVFGGEGEGPGEFRDLWGVAAYRGDSLVAFDYDLGRITIFPLRGETPRIVSLTNLFVRDVLPLTDGSFVARHAWASVALYEGESNVLHREPVPLLRLSAEGSVLDTVAMAAGYEELMVERGAMLPLFGKDSHFAVHEDWIYLGDADQLEYLVIMPSGDLSQIVRVPSFDLTVRPEDLGIETEVRLPPDPSPRALEGFSELPVPLTRPAYSGLRVDTGGFVWLEEYRSLWAPVRTVYPSDWHVFTPEGEWLGTVRIPPRFRVFEIGLDYVLGSHFDDMDVEHVQVLRLTRH